MISRRSFEHLLHAGIFLGLLVAWTGTAARAQDALPIDPAYHHLGDSTVNDWPGVAPKPAGTNLVRSFTIPRPIDGTLRLRQRDIHGVWRLRINGIEFAQLRRIAAERTAHYHLPATLLRSGTNRLEILPDNPTDDIAVGHFDWIPVPLRQFLDLTPVDIGVVNASGGAPLPARISIVTANSQPADIYFAEAELTAVRPGILYTTGRRQRIELPRGTYQIAATRGMEWSREERPWTAPPAGTRPARLDFRLQREVDTPGFVACDTHIHTFTISGHGNATIEERLVSIAGEGVELAVATDHNHQLDYRPWQEHLSLNRFFTPVTGNEVTTANGHFNAFPLDPRSPVPDHRESDWVKLVAGIRSRGARVVILNHPRWPDAVRNPFTRHGLNRASGDRPGGPAYTFDAMELVNSTALQKDPLYLFTDWFALLNRGEAIRAVGSSDTHTVDDPVGQGRTYIASSSDNPARLDVDEACRNLVAGRASLSLGIFADLQVNRDFRMGDLVPVRQQRVEARLRVAAPAWIAPERAIAFLNGVRVAEQAVPRRPGKPTDATLTFHLPTPAYDAYLVFVVLGPGVKAHGWKTYENYTLAATNPVFLDGDGDGRHTPLRREAERRLPPREGRADALARLLDAAEPELGVQMLAAAWPELAPAEVARLRPVIESLGTRHELYTLYLRHLPSP